MFLLNDEHLNLLRIRPIRYPKIFCGGTSRINDIKFTLYLSFDDGPNPMVTENVLKILKKYDAKATFFCNGINAKLYPDLLEKIKSDGHTIGNHAYSHLDAFKVKNKKWLIDALRKSPVSDSFFFRPPYGHIYPWQCARLKKEYKLVFWDVITYDFRLDYSAEKVKKIVRKKVRNGSIIVFHDTILAAPRMIPVLEDTLKHYGELGYKFGKL